jgi:hypothetical protein
MLNCYFREREVLLLDYIVKYNEMKSRWKTLLVLSAKPGGKSYRNIHMKAMVYNDMYVYVCNCWTQLTNTNISSMDFVELLSFFNVVQYTPFSYNFFHLNDVMFL